MIRFPAKATKTPATKTSIPITAMQSSELDDAKLLWKMFYGQQCFKRAQGVAEHIFNEKLEQESPLFYPLVTSLFVIYGRPFKRARGVGQLGDEMIPANHLELHRTLLAHRDQVYAHTDAEAFELAKYGEANQVRVLRTPSEMRLFATDFHARYPLMPSIIDLCATLQEKTGYHVEKLFRRYMGRVPQAVGEYGINVTDSNGDFFEKEQPMLLRQNPTSAPQSYEVFDPPPVLGLIEARDRAGQPLSDGRI